MYEHVNPTAEFTGEVIFLRLSWSSTLSPHLTLLITEINLTMNQSVNCELLLPSLIKHASCARHPTSKQVRGKYKLNRR
jgi:hypothetical protein